MEFATVVGFVADRTVVFDGAVVAAAAVVECVAAVANAEHCDVLAGASVVVDAAEIALVADDGAYAQEQGHLNSFQ